MQLPFSLLLTILTWVCNRPASSFTHAASEDNIFGVQQEDRIVCSLAMVEFFPARGSRDIPSQLRCIEKTTNKSYILSNLPDNLKRGISEENAYLLNTLVSIPASRAKNDPTIIDLNYDSRDIQFIGIDGDKSAVERTISKQFQGTSSTVVIRVTSGDGLSPTKSAAELSDDIFGTDGDLMNLVSGYQACSKNKLNFVPGTGTNIVNGVMEVSISQSVNGVSAGTVESYVRTKLQDLGYNLNSYTHTLIILPQEVNFGGAAAYAYVPGNVSVYLDGYSSILLVLMHEIGHNLGHYHSGQGNAEYGDPTCMMGAHSYEDEGPKSCFNAAKSWASGWYSDRHQSISTSISQNLEIQLVGIDDYVNDRFTSDQQRVVVKIGTNLYMMYNRAKGVNLQAQGHVNKVVIVEQASTVYATSWVRAALSAGESYQVNPSLSVKVTAIVNGQTESTLDYATVVIGNPNTLSPNTTPTISPAPSPECDNVKITWNTDQWSQEDNGFTITNIATGVVKESVPVGSMAANTNHEFDYCIPTKSDCYEFKAVDIYPYDGLTAGSNLSFQVNGIELLAVTPQDGTWTEKTVEFGDGCPSKAPTESPSNAPIKSTPPSPTPPSPTPPPCQAGDDVKVIWNTDKWSLSDNGFSITNIATGVVEESVSVGSMVGNTNYEFNYCIGTKSDCYEFKAVDTWGDGLTADTSNLSFQVNGVVLLAVTPQHGTWTEKSVEFGGSCAPNKPPTTAPNKSPTGRPNKPPSMAPIKSPTARPTNVPTEAPTSSDDSISFKNKVGDNLCMGVKGFYGGAPVITKSCSSTDNQQKFQIDDKGRIHMYTRPDMCLKKAKAFVKVAKCGGTNIFKFAYSSFDSRLVYYPAPLSNVLAIANDTPGLGQAIKLVSFNNNAQTQGWEIK